MVTEENWEVLAELEVHDSQEDFIADNIYSIAESKFNPNARPVGIFNNKTALGFLMYDVPDDNTGTYEIYRFMIDRKHQGRGYGRAALEALIANLQDLPDCERITICYVHENSAAQKFYASLGFKDIGRNEDGEIIAEICT